MKNIINENAITKSATLGELLTIIGPITEVTKIPFVKELCGERGEPIAIQKYQKMEVFGMKEFENVIQHVFTSMGDRVVYFLGGCDGLLIALVVFVVVEYITGLICNVIDKKLFREVGLRGIYRKVLIFILVGIANILDMEVIGTGSILRTAVIFFYLSNEGVSLLESAAYLGLPVPTKLKGVLESMALCYPGILADSFLNKLRSHTHFLQQFLQSCSQVIHTEYPVVDNLKYGVKCILFHEYFVHCYHEQILKLLVGQVQRFAFDVVEFVIALLDDAAVFVIRVPCLGDEMTATVAAHIFLGKDAGTDIPVLSCVLYFQLSLHHFKDSWQNNWETVVLYIELLDFHIIFYCFLVSKAKV